MNERACAVAVVTELQRQGFEVYQEVSTGYAGRRADIVGVRGPVLMVVECKVRLSLKLLDQLWWWQGEANYIVGAYSGGRVGVTVDAYVKAIGAGLWSVFAGEICETVAPRLHRRTHGRLRGCLRPEHRSAEYAKAGSQGGYFTPFRSTCRELYDVVKAHPGIELREALRRITHHYVSLKSAMSALPGLIRKGVVAGVRCDEGSPLKLYLEGQVPEWDPRDEIPARTSSSGSLLESA